METRALIFYYKQNESIIASQCWSKEEMKNSFEMPFIPLTNSTSLIHLHTFHTFPESMTLIFPFLWKLGRDHPAVSSWRQSFFQHRHHYWTVELFFLVPTFCWLILIGFFAPSGKMHIIMIYWLIFDWFIHLFIQLPNFQSPTWHFGLLTYLRHDKDGVCVPTPAYLDTPYYDMMNIPWFIYSRNL